MCNNFARRLKKRFFRKKVTLGKLLFLACFAANIRCSWYQWIQNCLAHLFLKKWEMNYEGQKIDLVFWRFFKIVIWRPMLKFCKFEDNRISYPKSIGSLGLWHYDAEIINWLWEVTSIILQASVISRWIGVTQNSRCVFYERDGTELSVNCRK